MNNLQNDLKTIRETLRKLNDKLSGDNLSIKEKKDELPIIVENAKLLSIWVGTINSESRLIQTNINIKEQERLTKRFEK